MHRFEHRRVGPGGVDIAAGRQADSAADRRGQVGDDVAEQVVGDDHVEPARIGNHVDGGGVDVLVGHLDVGVFLPHLGHHPRPQVAGEGQHVGLVHQSQVFAALGGAGEGVAHHPLHPVGGIEADLGGHLVVGAGADRAAGAGVGAFGAFPDDDEVDLREAGQRAGYTPIEPGGPQVDVVVQGEADFQQQTAFQQPAGHRRVADGAEQDGVIPAQFF